MARRTLVVTRGEFYSGVARRGKDTLLFNTNYASVIARIETKAGEDFFKRNKNNFGGLARAVIHFHYLNTLHGTVNLLGKGVPGASRFKSSIRVPVPMRSEYSRSASVMVKPHPYAGWMPLSLATRKRKIRTRSLGVGKYWKDQPTLLSVKKAKSITKTMAEQFAAEHEDSEGAVAPTRSLRDQAQFMKAQRLANVVRVALTSTEPVVASEMKATKVTSKGSRRAPVINTDLVVKIRTRLPDPLDELLRRAFVLGDVEEATKEILSADKSGVEKLNVLSYLEFGAERSSRRGKGGKMVSSTLPPRPFLRSYAARMGRDSQLQTMKALRKALRSTSV